MRFSKKAVVILMPSLLFALGGRAWSASSDQPVPTSAQIEPANPQDNSLLGVLSPVLRRTDPVPSQPQQNCSASQMYSQHDVVGDPESCFMGHYSFGSGPNAIAPVSVP
jgi:hypothetical protein